MQLTIATYENNLTNMASVIVVNQILILGSLS